MRCNLQFIAAQPGSGLNLFRCSNCGKECRGKTDDPKRVRQMCRASSPMEPPPVLNAAEIGELFQESDSTLLGERIKALTDAMGFPPCGGCDKRRQWLNKAHAWLRSLTDSASGS